MMQPLAIWLTCVCRPIPCVIASSCVPRHLGLCWSCVPGPPPDSTALPSMDHKQGIVCQLKSEHQIRPFAPSSVISRPTCFSSSLRCCWQVGSAPFVQCRCDSLANSAPTISIQTYLVPCSGLSWCPSAFYVHIKHYIFYHNCKCESVHFSMSTARKLGLQVQFFLEIAELEFLHCRSSFGHPTNTML